MLSFHNDPEIKEKYLARVRAHREADNIIQGIGWGNGKGCAVGCTLEYYDHSRYPIELGLPVWLARLEDKIHEGLLIEDAKLWPERFLESIPVGVNVDNVKHKMAIRRLNRLILIQENLLIQNPNMAEIFKQVISAIEAVKKCHESELDKTSCSLSEWSAACSAAESAAESAESAELAVELSAAWSAELAVESATLSAAWKQESDDLLELLSECK